MNILVDTNVWLRSAQPGNRQQSVASAATKALWAGRHELIVVPQVLYEFWVVATRPVGDNGLGLTAQRAEVELDGILRVCPIFPDDSGIYVAWRDLVASYAVLGKSAHDARLVAAMLRHGVTHLLSFNAADFARFTEVSVIAPDAASAFPPAA